MTAIQTAFAVLLGIGLLWLVVSLVLGDLSDLIGGGDAEAGGDVDADTDAGSGIEAGSGGDGFAAGDATADADSGMHGPSWTSSSIIATLLVGIGGSGLAATSFGLSAWLAVPLALVIGLLFAYLVLRFVLRPLMRQQANTAISQRTYLGSRATVTLEVAAGRTGQVRFTDLNHAIVELPAVPVHAEDRFVRGDVVVIHSVVSGKARVIAFDAPQLETP